MIHRCCLYEIFSRTNLISSCFSLRVDEWRRGTDQWRSYRYKARGHGQGHKKSSRPRPRAVFPRTDPLEAKDQGHRCKSFPKKRSSKFFFRRQARRQWGGIGGIAPLIAPPVFIFALPIYFLPPPTVFFLRSEHRPQS